MNGLSSKNKILILCITWLGISLAMFLYFFNILDASNRSTLDSMAQDKSDLFTLQQESESFKKSEADLAELSGKALQPEDLFSRDINFINEIKVIEGLAPKYNVKMQLSGVSGTINSAAPAKTTTPIVVIPYSVSLTGPINNVVNFIEAMENLPFISNVSNVNVNSGPPGTVNVGFSANFYLKK